MKQEQQNGLQGRPSRAGRSRLPVRVLALMAMLLPVPALAIDVAPGDYSVLPDGTFLGLTYFQYTNSDELKVGGVGEVPFSRVDSAVSLLRGVYYTNIGGVPVSAQAILPMGGFPSARIGGVDQETSQGLGDLTLGFTVYPLHSGDQEHGTTLGLTGFLTAPTGHYDAADVSLGSGTWSFTPQIGLIQGLGNGFFLDAAADIAFQSDHTENGLTLSRDPSIELQAYLRYQVSKATSVSFGYTGFFGGAGDVAGLETGLKTRSDQLRVFANTFISPTVQVQGMVGSDIAAEGSFKQNVVLQLRIAKVF